MGALDNWLRDQGFEGRPITAHLADALQMAMNAENRRYDPRNWPEGAPTHYKVFPAWYIEAARAMYRIDCKEPSGVKINSCIPARDWIGRRIDHLAALYKAEQAGDRERPTTSAP